MVKKEIESVIAKELEGLGFPGMFVVDYPRESAHGDYATNAAMVAAKELGKNPRDIAASLCQRLQGKLPFVERIEVASPGFINFHLKRSFFSKVVEEILKEKEWGRGEALKGKKVMVEHSQPNPFKPFHIGHLMSNALGESIARLAQFSGADVRTVNYQGDIGLHIAKAIWGIQEKKYDPSDVRKVGEAYAFGHAQYEDNLKAKEEILTINR